MSKVIGATIVALVLVVAMVSPTLAHTATATCEHITLGNVPDGVAATLTPGPIAISPPNTTTSINGTYQVPPATYLITFSDAFIINNVVVPACPSPGPSTPPSQSPSTPPSQSPSTPPSQSPSTPPSAAPSQSPSTPPSPSPSAVPSSNVTPAPTPTGSSGQVLGATSRPRSTAPATDTVADSNQDGLGSALPLFVSLLVGINIGLFMILRAPSRPTRRDRQG